MERVPKWKRSRSPLKVMGKENKEKMVLKVKENLWSRKETTANDDWGLREPFSQSKFLNNTFSSFASYMYVKLMARVRLCWK